MRVYIDTNGCAILRHETYRISKYFRLNGLEEVKEPTLADIVVVTGCGVTAAGEEEALSLIKNIKSQMTSSAKLIIGGCLPKIAKEQVLSIAPDAMLIGYEESYKYDQLIRATIPLDEVYYNTGHPIKYYFDEEKFEEDPDLCLASKIDALCNTDKMTLQYTYSTPRHYLWKESDVFQIRVSYGCGGNCSFCITKLGIGKFRSIPIEKIFKQFREGLALGYKRFVLVGDEIGFYGLEIGTDFATLIEGLYAIDPGIQIAIRYIYPDMLVRYYSRLRKFFEQGYIFYFCTAIQTASPRLLKMMNRNPNIGPFVECIKDIRSNNFPVFVHSQIIVGFPSETDEDFALTLKCLMDCDFDHFNINKFSMRRNTQACEYKDLQIADDVMQKRYEIMVSYLKISRMARLYDTAKQCILNSESNEN